MGRKEPRIILMVKKPTTSTRTRSNYFIDASLFISALVAILTGMYFLYLPIGGYQGGRNATFGITLLFERGTWDLLHMWSGVAMILIAAIHIPFHWGWIKNMVRKVVSGAMGRKTGMSTRSRANLILNALLALGFLLAAISGVALLFSPHFRGINNTGASYLLISRATWDMLHTWSSVLMALTALLHLAIHWRWILNVTSKILGGSSKARGFAITPSIETS